MKVSFPKKVSYRHYNNKVTVCQLPFKFDYNVTDNEKVSSLFAVFMQEILEALSSDNLINEGISEGKALCNSSDTFSEEIGARIAESRAKLSVYKYAYRKFKLLAKEVRKALANIDRTIAKLEKCIATEEAHLNSLSK